MHPLCEVVNHLVSLASIPLLYYRQPLIKSHDIDMETEILSHDEQDDS